MFHSLPASFHQQKHLLARKRKLQIHKMLTTSDPFSYLFRNTEPFQSLKHIKKKQNFWIANIAESSIHGPFSLNVSAFFPSPRRVADRVAILLIQTTSTWKTRCSRCNLNLDRRESGLGCLIWIDDYSSLHKSIESIYLSLSIYHYFVYHC